MFDIMGIKCLIVITMEEVRQRQSARMSIPYFSL